MGFGCFLFGSLLFLFWFLVLVFTYTLSALFWEKTLEFLFPYFIYFWIVLHFLYLITKKNRKKKFVSITCCSKGVIVNKGVNKSVIVNLSCCKCNLFCSICFPIKVYLFWYLLFVSQLIALWYSSLFKFMPCYKCHLTCHLLFTCFNTCFLILFFFFLVNRFLSVYALLGFSHFPSLLFNQPSLLWF